MPVAGAAVVASWTGEDREDALDRLRGWVEQVYRPGYGQLAATLGPCWEQHPLCLYGLDVLAELWSVLYLQAGRTPAVVSAQAEFQARIVPGHRRAADDRDHPLRPRAARPRRVNGAAGACREPPQRPDEPDAGTGAGLRPARLAGVPLQARPQGTRHPHGFKDATTDPGRITAWWTAVPGRNVAIATGAPGPDVLDVDVRPGGSGYPAWRTAAARRAAGRLRSPSWRTPSGGLHAYYAGTGQASGRLSRPPPGLQGHRRVRPRPAVGRRRQALPADPASAGPPGGRRAARLGRRHRLAGPAAADSRSQRGRQAMPMPSGWPPGSPGCPKATGTPACSGPPAAPPKPGTPAHSTLWPRLRRPPGCPSRRSSGPSPPHGAAPGTAQPGPPATAPSVDPNPNPNTSPRR